MKTVSYYDLTTGLFTGHTFSGPEQLIQWKLGQAYIEGRFDHLSQRVDLSAGSVVDYQPDPPAADEWQTWAWDATTRRNIATPTLAALKRDRKQPVLDALAAEDAKLIRPNGEIAQALATSTTPPTAAVDRVIAINAAKQTLRDKLAAIDAAQDAAALEALGA